MAKVQTSVASASLNVARRTHHGRGLLGVGAVVAAHVGRLPLDTDQLLGDGLARSRPASSPSGSKAAASSASSVCRGQLLRPVEREVEVRPAVVDRADLAGRRPVLVEERARGAVERVGQHLRPLVAGPVGVVLEGHGQREELAEAVPAQVVLLDELLHVLGRGAAGAGLEQAAAVDQRDDREHLGRGAELEDREQVGVVVAQHVAGHRDGVQALADALDGELRGARPARGSGCRGRRCRARAGRRSPWRSGWRRGHGSRPARTPPGRRSRGPG